MRSSLLPSIAALSIMARATHGAPPMPPAVRRVLRAQADDRHTGDTCPRCHGLRVWVVDETLRCRDCGTRFLPADLPPDMVLGRRLRVWRRNGWTAPYCRRGYGLLLFGCGPWSGILSLYPAPRARP